MSRLRLVADDLTGTLDAAAQFTGLLGPVPCALTPGGGWPDDCDLAVNAACREGAEADAVAAAIETVKLFSGAAIAFKKIDSLLRGHWAAELAAIVRTRRFGRVILSPAFPAQHRVTRQGRQWLGRSDGGWTCLAADPAVEFERHGVTVARADPRHLGGEHTAADVILCDAETQQDLDALVSAASAMPGPILWCGSAGLARSLSGTAPAAIQPRAGPHLVIVGTHHPVSRDQIAHVSARAPECVVAIDNGLRASAARVEAALASGSCVAFFSLPDATPTFEAATTIANRLQDLVAHVAAPANVTIVGGETFLAFCRALQTRSLSLEGEYEPGVPASRLVGGLWEGTRVLSKSGAFGRSATLADLVGFAATG